MLATVVAVTAIFAFILVTHNYALRAIYADALGTVEKLEPSNSISKLHYEEPPHSN